MQRPAIEAKLIGDVQVLKGLAKAVRGVEALPVDYYTVFSELEEQLADEFDFIKEAAAMERIGRALSTDPVIPIWQLGFSPRVQKMTTTHQINGFRTQSLSRTLDF